MEKELAGKKVLILGGSILSKDIVTTAKEMGLYTIVADWYDVHRSPIKLMADEHCNISIEDYEQLSNLIREKKIDGVFTSFTDSYLLPYQKLCEMNNLPFYASKTAFENSVNKYLFKRMCERNNVPVVPEYDYKSFDPTTLSSKNAIVIKPVDNSGARGITYCDNPYDFDILIGVALNNSPSKQIILEKFISNKGTTMSVRYIASEGELFLHLVGDRYVLDDTDGKALITAASFYPSKYTKFYMDNYDSKVKQMFKSVGVSNGALFMESFCDGDNLYFYEMGMRLSGAMTYNITKSTNDVNELKMLLRYAVTGKMCSTQELERIDPFLNGHYSASIALPLTVGKIDSIEGISAITKHPKVYAFSQRYQVGDIIEEHHMGTLFQLLGRFSIITDNKQELIDTITMIANSLSVKDKDGNEMFISSKLREILNDYIS